MRTIPDQAILGEGLTLISAKQGPEAIGASDPKPPTSRDGMIAHLIEHGCSVNEVADVFGVHRNSVPRIVKRFAASAKAQARAEEMVELRDDYRDNPGYDDGMSIEQREESTRWFEQQIA